MNPEAKKIFVSLAFIAAGIWSTDRCIGLAGECALEQMPRSEVQFARINYAMLGCQADVVILGSSKAGHHYDAAMLADSLGMSVYNAGADGRGITYSYGVFRAICERTNPKIVILELLYDELNGSLNDRIDILKPYIPRYDFVGDMTRRINGPTESCKNYWASYRFNSLVPTILQASIATGTASTGYSPLDDNGRGAAIRIVRDSILSPVDPVSGEALAEMSRYAREHDIRLIVTVSPELIDHRMSSPLEAFCEEQGIPFIDNSALAPFMQRKELFNDNMHLNRQGAELYTQYFIEQLKKSTL